jgi:hypothetical protein
VALFAALLLVAGACGDDSESSGVSKSAPTDKGVDYPESTAGLELFIEEVVSATGDGNRAAIDRLTARLALADHQQWFETTFGEDKGALLAADYGAIVGRIAQMSELFTELVGKGQTRVRIERFERSGDPAAVGYQSQALAAMVKPTALYSVRMRAPGKDHGFHLWSFVYHDGGFRWVGKLKAMSAPSAYSGDIDPLEVRLRDAHSVAENR